MNNCKHKWVRRSDNWTVFRCATCGIIGYFQKRWKNAFKITPYICQKSKCKKFATKINGIGERYCDEHYVEKHHKEWACVDSKGEGRHKPINPEDYYESFTGKNKY